MKPGNPVPSYNLPVDRTAAKLLEEARRLPSEEFNWLIGELLQAGDGSSDAEIEASWKSEVERRVPRPMREPGLPLPGKRWKRLCVPG